MSRLVVSIALVVGALTFGAWPGRPQVPPDTTEQLLNPPADTSEARLVPLSKTPAGGVRIRSIHDNRRIIILRPRARVIGTVSPVDSMSRLRTISSEDLRQLERRLRAHIDKRLTELEVSRRASVRSLFSSPGRIVLVPNSSGGTDIVLLPPGDFRSSLSDTAGVDSLLLPSLALRTDTAGVLLQDTTWLHVSDTAGVPSRDMRPVLEPDTAGARGQLESFVSGLDVVEVERSILETGLLRTVNVLFDSNRATLIPASVLTLNSLGYVLEKYPDLQLEISGHTDSSGPEEHNLWLSEKRAEAVRDYLISNFSIDPGRLSARGYGELRPIAEEDTATGRALNRRVEFTVLSYY